MAKVTGQAQGVAVSSGTAALYLALMALRIGSGDEVVIPSYVCTALWHAVHLTGATPVLVDIEPATYQDRKSTRLNSSHVRISYAVFCLKKKKKKNMNIITERLSIRP